MTVRRNVNGAMPCTTRTATSDYQSAGRVPDAGGLWLSRHSGSGARLVAREKQYITDMILCVTMTVVTL